MTARRLLHTLLPGLTQHFDRRWYEAVSRLDRDAVLLFLNHGYAAHDPTGRTLELTIEEERDRYPIQLYDHVASALDWVGLEALEVGSGRGGGSAYIKRRFEPASYVGIDITPRAIDFCCQHYATDGLHFALGDAESLPFAGDSLDVVINVESSVYYPRVQRFFSEVARVLRPSGWFLYADMRYWEDIPAWREQLARAGFRLVVEEDITPNVVRALELDGARRRMLIDQYVPRMLRGMFRGFAGLDGAGLARGSGKTGERVYVNFVLRKATAGRC
jgi:SAM-dependent methyltransferase